MELCDKKASFKMRRSDMRVIDDAFDMHGGYVMNFTDSTFAEFFEDELSRFFCNPRSI
jgi:hypothetical protein